MNRERARTFIWYCLLGEAEKGRAENINAIRAAWKEKEGIIDAEVIAWNELEETITSVPQTMQNAVDLWTKSVADWLISDKAQANNLANQWKNAMTDLGAIVFEKGIGGSGFCVVPDEDGHWAAGRLY